MIDKQVLDGTTSDLMAEPAKERLFDVLMRRLDAMAPHRPAIREIMAWAKRDPLSAAALNQVALNSMRFMLEAAEISSEGAVGAVKLQGLVLGWARILEVWYDDEDPTCARLAQNYALMIAPPSGQGLINPPQAGPQRTGPAFDPSQMRNPAPRAQGSTYAQAYRAAYDKCRATKS
jgi:hypothetical protein